MNQHNTNGARDCQKPLKDDDYHLIKVSIERDGKTIKTISDKGLFSVGWKSLLLIPVITLFFASVWFVVTTAFKFTLLFKFFISVAFFLSFVRLMVIIGDKINLSGKHPDTSSYEYAQNKLGLVYMAIAGLAVVSWWLWPNWIMMDLMALTICAYFFIEIPPVPIKTTMLIGAGIMLFDLIIVYFSSRMTDLAVSAIDNRIPIMIAWPASSSGISSFGGIGLGDIIIPGYILKQVWFRARAKHRMRWLLVALLAYFIGVGGALAASYIFNAGQPALVFIIPSLIIAISILWLTDKRFE